ncbi:MAG: YdeI/OmpD-associated family protein [Prevotella sp.]|nr:YdeI/OmpD-associated family protein [Prevotella sp.]
MDQLLFRKLDLAKYARKAIIDCPEDVQAFDGIDFDRTLGAGRYDLVFHFIFSLDEFAARVHDLIRQDRINPGGVAFFAYPKKGNRRYDTYIGRDDFFTVIDMDNDGYVDDSDLKFNKMVAFNDVFTVIGLKHAHKRRQSRQPSQCVSAYVDRLPELIERLSAHPDALARFNSLTPGYQRGWARYVFGVSAEATVVRHLQEMADILVQGYKSVDLYRAGRKQNGASAAG